MSNEEIAELKEKHIAELEKKLDEAKYIINELLDLTKVTRALIFYQR